VCLELYPPAPMSEQNDYPTAQVPALSGTPSAVPALSSTPEFPHVSPEQQLRIHRLLVIIYGSFLDVLKQGKSIEQIEAEVINRIAGALTGTEKTVYALVNEQQKGGGRISEDQEKALVQKEVSQHFAGY